MGRRAYAGNAGATTLASDITAGSTSIAVVSATNWPSPTGGAVSVAVIDRGQSSEEKITFSGRTGNTLTGCVRGFDSTTAATHLAGVAVEHGLSAADMDETNDHVFTTTRDDHTQYTNNARHDITARHAFGAALGTPAAATAIPFTGVSAAGAGGAPSRENHVHGYNPPACRVYNSANINLATSGLLQVLTFDTERFDTDTMHSTVSNTGRITFTTAGIYAIHASVSFAGNATGFRQVAFRVNGTTFILSDVRAAIATSIEIATGSIYKFAAGDYVECLAQQTSTAPLNVSALSNYSPEFAATWIGVG